MENLVFLILVMALPGLIRRLVKQSQAAKPAAPSRRRPRADAPPPVAGQELPPWLESLAEKLGAPISTGETTAAPAPAPARTQRPSFAEEGLRDAEAHPELTEGSAAERGTWDVTPGADWQRFEAEAEQQRAAVASALRDWEHPGESLAAPTPPMAALPSVARRGPRHVVPAGRDGWRRAVLLAEILGPPRGVEPWRESAGS